MAQTNIQCNRCCQFGIPDSMARCCQCQKGFVHFQCMKMNSRCMNCGKAYTGAMKSEINDAVITLESYRHSKCSKKGAMEKISKHRRTIERALLNQTQKEANSRMHMQLNIHNTLAQQDATDDLAAKRERVNYWEDFIDGFGGSKFRNRMKFKMCLDNLTMECDAIRKLKENQRKGNEKNKLNCV